MNRFLECGKQIRAKMISIVYNTAHASFQIVLRRAVLELCRMFHTSSIECARKDREGHEDLLHEVDETRAEYGTN